MRRKFAVAVALAVLAWGSCTSAAAQDHPDAAPVFARIFATHAVLQRDRPITIWGTARAGEAVTVTLGASAMRGRADAHGKWRMLLPAMAAGGPYALSVAGAGGTTRIADVKIGDVYLCGGQSNMEFPARLSTNAWSGFPANDDLRFVNIPRDSQPAPRDDFKEPVNWQVAARDTIGEASAVCYYMARSLQRTAGVPVGFIHASWGGTTIQSWIAARSLRSIKAYATGIDAVEQLATDPAAARATEERRQEAWWDAHDPQATAQRAWIAPGFDDSSWREMARPGPWKESGVAGLADFEGVMWLRTTVTLSEVQARAANRLQLGTVDASDTCWINGVRVGGSGIFWLWRNYDVPARLFHAGRNVIALRVLGGSHGGGLTGHPRDRGIGTTDGQFIQLDGPWRYQPAMRAHDIAPPPTPWEVPTSLTTLYNGMVAPLGGYSFKLVAWYQGEANADDGAGYRALLPLLMADWRRHFTQPDLPFLIVQLTAFGDVATRPGHSGWAELRAAQADAVAGDRHAALVVTLDVGDRTDIHPTQKTVVGERLARAARAVAYGEPVTPGGPEATDVAREGSDLVVVFRHTNGGLRTYSADVAIGFEACAGDVCRYVTGTVRGDSIVLGGANRPDVTKVRYAWADAPFVNLYSADDLPAAPFERAAP